MPSWFEQQGIPGYQTDLYESGGITGGTGGQMPVLTAGAPPEAQTNAFNAGQQVGHDGTTTGGLTREQYRDAWQGSGAKSMDDLNRFIQANGGTLQSGNGTVMTPFGESIDMGINARGSAAGNGQLSAGWGGVGGPATPAAPAPALGGGMPAPTIPATGGGGIPGGGGGSAGSGGGAGGWDGTKFTSAPLTAAPTFTPTNVAGPAPLSLAQLSQPAAVTADQVGPGAQVSAPTVGPGERVTSGTVQQGDRVTASQVTGPAALQAQQLQNADPLHNLTADELQQDPSYQFRLKEALGAIQNSTAAKGTYFGGATLKALGDRASQEASQEYAAANQRARDVQQGNITNRANTVGQNNAANAQAYGLTNQYQQQAQLANQSAGLQAGQFNSAQQQAASAANVGNQLQAGQFNSAQGQQTAQFNAANQLQAGQFNSAQGQQAALANQNANLQAGQFNAGMNFNTQQGNIANSLAAYNAYQPLAQQNAQFNAGQQATAAQNNFANRFAVEQGNNANAQNAWQGNVNAQLGQGGLANQQASTANQYAIGMGNIGLGYAQNDTTRQGQANQYALGLGNLGVSQGQLGLAGQAQSFNQGLQTFNANQGVYQYNNDSTFAQNLALAQLGLSSAGNYGNQAGSAYTNQGNANAAAGIAQGNAWGGALGNLGNTAEQYGYWRGGF